MAQESDKAQSYRICLIDPQTQKTIDNYNRKPNENGPIPTPGVPIVSTFPSPNGRYILTTRLNDDAESYRVILINGRDQKVIDSYNPETRAIVAVWNSTSTMVAIDEDISHSTGNLSLWRIVHGRFHKITLPPKLLDDILPNGQRDAIDHFIPAKDDKRIKFWWGAHCPEAGGWLNETDLNVGIGGVAQLEGNYQLSMEYDLVLHVVPPKITILSETKKSYEISEEKPHY